MSATNMELPDKPHRFQYRQLDKDAQEIRLVQLQPSLDDQSPIRMILKVISIRSEQLDSYNRGEEALREYRSLRGGYYAENKWEYVRKHQDYVELLRQISQFESALRENLDFVALSYVWGPDSPTQDVCVQDKDQVGWLSIRQNLFDFLTVRRRDQTISPWYWIDQICIDQDNTLEKGHQVNQMSEVYTRAKTVEVWLGPSFEGSDEAMDYMRRCFRSGHDTGQYLDEHLPALTRLVCLPYWNRLWIVQELILGENKIVCLGDQSLCWETEFKPAILYIIACLPLRLCWLSQMLNHVHIQRIGDFFDNRARQCAMSWLEAYSLVSKQQCSDVRDKVFGALSLVDKSLRFYPDYSLGVQDILLCLLRKAQSSQLETRLYQKLDFLTQCWQELLDASCQEIDLKVIRRWIVEEAHEALRADRYRNKSSPETIRQRIVERNRAFRALRDSEKSSSETILERVIGSTWLYIQPGYWYCHEVWEHSMYQASYIGQVGHGPTWAVRAHMWWKFPSKGSLRWHSPWLRHEYTFCVVDNTSHAVEGRDNRVSA